MGFCLESWANWPIQRRCLRSGVIIEGQLLIHPDSPNRACGLQFGQILLNQDRVEAVAFGKRLGTADLGGPEVLVSPGFIDAHLHLPQFDCIGIDGLDLLTWLERAVFPTEARWSDPAWAGDRTARVAHRLLAAGTTGVCAYATVHHEATKVAMSVLAERGLRGYVGQVMMDQNGPEELTRYTARAIEETVQLKTTKRIAPAITPRFAVSCSRELLHRAGALAKATGWPVQTHLSETRAECVLVEALHGEESYTQVYMNAGLLTPRTILGHGIWLADKEKSAIAQAGSAVAHCPTANVFLQAGLMDRAAHAASGLKIALGSDIAGGPDVCMLRVARAMIETAKIRSLAGPMQMEVDRAIVPTPAQAWWQVTAGNADALGWSDAGRLFAGAAADVVLIDPRRGEEWGGSQPGWMSSVDPLSLVMYAFDERWISHTIISGRVTSASGAM